METQKNSRFTCVLFIAAVILVVVTAFIFKSTVTNIEPSQKTTDAVMAKECKEQNDVATSSAIVSQSSIASSSSVSSEIATSSSISDENEKKKQEQKRRKLKEQRRKRLLQKKRAERKRRLEQKKKAQQRKLTKAKAYSYTQLELITLSKIIWAEARGESYVGKVSVGAVAVNRVNTGSKEFGAENGKLIEVLLKKWAFADISHLSDEEFINSPYYEECVKAAKAALEGEDPTREYFPNGALFFYDTTIELSEKQTRCRQGIDTYQIGCHAFHIELND